MHEPLSEQAERMLDRLVAELRPTAEEETRARQRLEASLAFASHDEPWPDRTANTLRGAFTWMRRGWGAFANFVLLTAAALQLVRGEIHPGRAHLELAADVFGWGEPRAAAHRFLVERTRGDHGDAEARIVLVLDALCGLDEPEAARRELEHHLSVHPGSKHRRRLGAPCTDRDPADGR